MEEFSKIKKNSFFYLISTLSRLVSNALIFIIIARFYGSDMYGSFTAAHTMSTLFLVLADFGFDLLIISEVARNPQNANQTFLRFMPIKVLFTFLSFSLILLTIMILPVAVITIQILFIFSFNMIFTALTNNFFAFFRGIEKFIVEAKVALVVNIIILISVWICSFYAIDLLLIALIITLSRLLGLFIVYRNYSQLYTLKEIKNGIFNIKEDFKKVSIFGLHMLFGTLYFQIDTVLLVAIRGEIETGLFQAVFKLLVIILIIPELITGAILPTVVRLYSLKDNRWSNLIRVIFKLLVLVCLPISFAILMYPSIILRLIYSREEFLIAAPIFQISAAIVFFRFIAEPIAMVLTIMNRQIIRTIIVFVATILSIVLNIIFIPDFGMTGAIVVSLITNFFALCAYTVSIRNILGKIIWDKKLWLTVSMMLIAFILIYNLVQYESIFFAIIMFLVYSSFVFFYNFSKYERLLIFSLKGRS